MSLKKLAALLSVICISVALNGCGPAAETPTPGEAPGASSSGESAGGEATEAGAEEGGAESEGASATE